MFKPTAKATGGSNDQGGKFNYRQQKVIAGAESLICHHLLHLIQPFKQRNWSTNNPQNTENKSANTQHEHRIFHLIHHRVQPW